MKAQLHQARLVSVYRLISSRFAVPVAAVLFFLLAACAREAFDYADSLRQQIDSLEKSMNQGKSEVLMAAIADDFSSDYLLDRRQLKLFLLRQRSQYKRITSTSGPLTVAVNFAETGVTATASFKTLLTGSQNWLPESGQFYQFETSWRWRDGAAKEEQWELIHASWEPVFD